MNITNSPDITMLQVQAIFDLSVPVPVLRFVNQSVGAHLGNVKYAFQVYSPNYQPIHVGDIATPDITGAWTEYDVPEGLPVFSTSIEWSGYPYNIAISIKDSAGTVIVVPAQPIYVITPAGNDKVGGNYGEGQIEVSVDCLTKEALIRDRTAYMYRGISGKILPASSINVLQPSDQYGNTPAPVPFIGFSQVAFPLTVSGEGYRAVLQSYVDYDDFQMGGLKTVNATVRLKYIKTQKFDVNCNYDLCPLLFEYSRLLDAAEVACDVNLDRKISKISYLLTEALIVKLQPTCGVSLGDLIKEIKEYAGWDCDCNCEGPIGLNGNLSSNPGALNIQFSLDGDMTAAAEVNGNNILLTLKDYRYIFQVGATADARAFSVQPATAGRVKTFTLNVDLEDLSEDILAKIGSVPALINSLNALVKTSFNFTVDGKCIIATNPACDYLISLPGIPGMPGTKLFKTITIGGVVYSINVAISTTNGLTILKTSLDNLGKGTFLVNVDAGTLNIVSVSNQNSIDQAVMYDTEDRIMAITKSNCAQSVTYSPSEIVQAMINYLCKIDASQVRLGYDFVFAKMKPDGTLEQVAFKTTDSLKSFIEVVTSNAYVAISVVRGSTVTFATLQALFANTTSLIKATDVLYGTRDGVAGQWSQADILKSIIATVKATNDASLLTDWCLAINRCSAAGACNPVTGIVVALRTIQKEDFRLVGTDLVFSGYYTTFNLPSNVTVTFTPVDQAGNLGAPATAVMNGGTNRITDVVSTLPALSPGYSWKITAIASAITTQYLSVAIVNNGAANYKVATRRTSFLTPIIYTAYPKQEGVYTNLLFVVLSGNYEAFVMAVCGVNNESAVVSAGTSPCATATSFNVLRSGSNFIITYAFPVGTPQYNLRVDYPSGGNSDDNYPVDISGQKTIPIPPGTFGDYSFRLRAVCDVVTEWYGAFAGPIIVTVSAADHVAPNGLVVTDITANTATATATAPVPAPAALTVTLILTPVGGGVTRTFTQAPNLLTWLLTGLTPGTVYTPGVRYDYADGGTSAVVTGANFTTLSLPAGRTVLFDFTSTPVTEANVDGFVLTLSKSIVHGQIYYVELGDAPQFQYFIVREDADEPAKGHYVNQFNSETIPGFTWSVVVKGPYRYYYTPAPVSFDPQDFIHFNP